MDHRSRSPARLLAPIALVAFVLALFAVVVGSDAPDDSDGGGGSNGSSQQADTGTGTETTADDAPRPSGTFYTVKTGDTLAGIAESVGLTVDDLLELNPALDPQTLVSGQKIRLRE